LNLLCQGAGAKTYFSWISSHPFSPNRSNNQTWVLLKHSLQLASFKYLYSSCRWSCPVSRLENLHVCWCFPNFSSVWKYSLIYIYFNFHMPTWYLPLDARSNHLTFSMTKMELLIPSTPSLYPTRLNYYHFLSYKSSNSPVYIIFPQFILYSHFKH
jgi:hypothetical protein